MGQVKFYPYKRAGGGGRKSLSHDEGGGGGEGTNSFEVVLTRELSVLAILMRLKVSEPRFSHSVALKQRKHK